MTTATKCSTSEYQEETCSWYPNSTPHWFKPGKKGSNGSHSRPQTSQWRAQSQATHPSSEPYHSNSSNNHSKSQPPRLSSWSKQEGNTLSSSHLAAAAAAAAATGLKEVPFATRRDMNNNNNNNKKKATGVVGWRCLCYLCLGLLFFKFFFL